MNDSKNNNEIREKNDSFMKIKINTSVRLNFWKNCAVIAFGILLAALLFPNSISIGNIFSYTGIVFLIWVLNAVLRPFLILFTLPLIVLSFGAGMIFINALVIWIASGFIPEVKFSSYFFALFTSALIEILSWAVAIFESERVVRNKKKEDDVIDV